MSSSSSGAGGAGGDGGSGGSCTNDMYEANDTQATATDLGQINDCDKNGSSVSGVLAGGDVDWFTYKGSDTFGCSVNPSRDITSDGQAKLCKYIRCPGLKLDKCPNDSTSDTSPEGDPGCCTTTKMELGINCNGASDDATIFLKVEKPPAFTCVNYTFNYHY